MAAGFYGREGQERLGMESSVRLAQDGSWDIEEPHSRNHRVHETCKKLNVYPIPSFYSQLITINFSLVTGTKNNIKQSWCQRLQLRPRESSKKILHISSLLSFGVRWPRSAAREPLALPDKPRIFPIRWCLVSTLARTSNCWFHL